MQYCDSCFGLAGFLAFHNAGVAGHEAFGAESRLVFGVDLHQSAGDGETESLGLTFVTAAVDVDRDVVFVGAVKSLEGLEHDVLENRRGEVLVEGATGVVAGDVDGAVALDRKSTRLNSSHWS